MSVFRQNFNRYIVLGSDGIKYLLSVVESLNETIESAMLDSGIKVQILVKGSIIDYN